jgi:hypothetical protein
MHRIASAKEASTVVLAAPSVMTSLAFMTIILLSPG